MSSQSHDGSKVAIFYLVTFPHVCFAALTTAQMMQSIVQLTFTFRLDYNINNRSHSCNDPTAETSSFLTASEMMAVGELLCY